MINWATRMGVVAGVCAVALTGTKEASASTEHYLTIVPGPVLLNESADISNCIKANIFGGLQLDFNTGMGSCPWVSSISTGWSAWAGGDINVPWAPNPGSTASAIWNVTVPANTEFRARVALMDQNGSPASVGSWVNGGGVQEGFAGVAGFGGMILNFQMRSFRAAAGGSSPTPVLHTVAGQVYSS
jgi:hypothetical protein